MSQLITRCDLEEPDTSAALVPHKSARPDKAEGWRPFRIVSEYQPAGDQPTAIAGLVAGDCGGQSRSQCTASAATWNTRTTSSVSASIR
jgi:excinuclease ABC subunit B